MCTIPQILSLPGCVGHETTTEMLDNFIIINFDYIASAEMQLKELCPILGPESSGLSEFIHGLVISHHNNLITKIK